jgi:serine/threonine-protein kinase RsbW
VTTKKKIERELVIKSSTDNLAVVREFIETSALESGFSEEVVKKISLAVDEACTNIIKHAYNYSPDNDIVILTKFFDSKFTVTITDTGQNFNPRLIPEHKVGGLGMYLMKKLMDEVKYNTLSGNQNQVVLVKYLT